MYNSYKQSSNKKYGDIATAAKTNYQEVSPYREVSGFRSPSRYSLHLSEAKNTISSLIGEVSAKKSMNQEGIKRVKSTNQEALDYYGNNDQDYENDGYNRFSNPINSYYSPTSKNLASTHYSGGGSVNRPFRSANYQNDYQRTGSFPTHHQTPSQFNLENNQNLQTYQFNDNQVSPYQNQIPKASNNQLRQALGKQISQNQYLANKIAQLQGGNRGGSYTNSKSVPQGILRQLEELKAENQRLRRDTVVLLKNKKAHY